MTTIVAVTALVRATGGLVLAARTLAPLASDSPASGIFGDATEGQTAGETATPSAAVGTGLFAVDLMTWALRG